MAAARSADQVKAAKYDGGMQPLRPTDWPKYIRSGYRLYFGSHGACPHALIGQFLEQVHQFNDLEVVHIMTLGGAPWSDPKYAPHLRLNSFFLGAGSREAVGRGEADYTPCFLSEIPRLFTDRTVPIDTAFVMVTPPDKHGYCSLGVSVDVGLAAVRSARFVLAQVNPLLPRTSGECFVHVDDIDAFIEAPAPILEHVCRGGGDAAAAQIGKYCALLVDDGCCLQAGIGRIPDAVMRNLKDRNDLGIHTEVLGDGLMDLIQNGNVTNAKKSLNRGTSVTAFVMGTKKLYDFVHENPHIEMRPAEYTNAPMNIARNANQISINGALEVDLTGQVVADAIGPRFYSGIGGQVDFIRGAGLSPGGRPVIALESTAKGGTLSRIVSSLSQGSGVVTSRGDVHYVVTEYGIATLRGRSIRERALEMIQVAHPKFRDQLQSEAVGRKWIPAFAAPAKEVPELSGAGACEISRVTVAGEPMFLRPLHPSDQRRLQEFFYSHTDETLRQRYRQVPKQLSTEQAYKLVGVDQTADLAFGLFARQGPRETIHGVGRFFREGDGAEVAFVVGEAMRGKGIGTLLAQRLIGIAKQRGIKRLQAMVHADNHAMRHVLTKLGFVFTRVPDDFSEFEGVLELEDKA